MDRGYGSWQDNGDLFGKLIAWLASSDIKAWCRDVRFYLGADMPDAGIDVCKVSLAEIAHLSSWAGGDGVPDEMKKPMG